MSSYAAPPPVLLTFYATVWIQAISRSLVNVRIGLFRGWSPLPFMIFTHVILKWINPSSKRRHYRFFDLHQSKTLEIRLTVSISENCIMNSSSTGLIVIRGLCRRFRLLPRLLLLRRSFSVKSLQSTTILSRSSTSPPVFTECAILFRFLGSIRFFRVSTEI